MTNIDWLKVSQEAKAYNLAKQQSSVSSLKYGDPSAPAPSSNSVNATSRLNTPNPTYASAEPYLPYLTKFWTKGYDTDKAIHTAFFESGFKSESALAPGSDGATGIFRIQNLAGRPDPSILINPEQNIKYASWLAYGSQGNWQDWKGPNPNQKADFTPWGDNGATYTDANGVKRTYGALSVHPYPGDAPIPPIPPDYQARIGVASHDSQQAQIITKQASSAYEAWVSTENQKRDLEIEQNVDLNFLPKEKGGKYTRDGKLSSGGGGLPFVSVSPALVDAGLSILDVLGLSNKDSVDKNQAKIDEATTKAQAITDKYAQEENKVLATLNQAKSTEKTATQWEWILKALPSIVTAPDTHISNIDELEKYLASSDPNTGDIPVANRGQQAFTPEQREYLDSLIKSIYPQLGKGGQTLSDKQQLAEYLTKKPTELPSRRISIAGLSTQNIKSLLTTLPNGGKSTIGLSKEEVDRILSAQELASPEAKKAFETIQASAKPLLEQWQEIDNQYKAWQLGTAFVNPNLKEFKARNESIGRIALDKLEVYADNWTRPAAAYGIIDVLPKVRAILDPLGIATIGTDAFKSILPNDGLLGIPGFIKGTLYPNTDDLRNRIEANKAAGQNWWEAGAHGFKDWDANFLVKMAAEGAVDPLNYLGFGMYTKITKPLPYLGRAVAAAEEGWRLAFENPVVTRAGLATIGAGIGYNEGGTRGALVGAGTFGLLPSLRGVPLYTVKQLTERYRFNFLADLSKAMTLGTNRTNMQGITNEEVINVLEDGLRAVQIDPLTAHNHEAGALVKTYLDHINAPISDEEVAGLRASINRTPEEALAIGVKPTTQQKVDLQHYYDMLFHTTKRGVMAVEQVAENWARVLDLDKAAIPQVEGFIKERIANSIDLFKSNFKSEGVDTLASLSTSYVKSVEASFRDPTHDWGRFQGLIMGLNRKIDPITTSKGYKALDWAQTQYARSALLFTTFKPFNYLETHFRAGIAGGGWNLPVTADEIIGAAEYHSWNPSYPWELRDANRRSGRSEIALVSGDKTSLDAIQKKKNLFVNVKDWVVGDNLDRIGLQKAAQAYNKFVIDEFSRINPEVYGQLITLQNKGRTLLKNSGVPDDEIQGRLTDLLNFSLRPDGSELIRNQISDLPTYEKKAFIKEAAKAMAGLEDLDTPFQNYILRRFERGEWNNVNQIIEDLKPSLYEHSIVKGEIAGEALTNQADLMIKSLSTPEDFLKPISSPDLNTLDNIIEAPTQAYHGSGREISEFIPEVNDPIALFGPGAYLTSDPQIAKGYATTRATQATRRRERYIKDFPTQRDINLYPEGKATVHSVEIQPGTQLLNLEKPMPDNLGNVFQAFGDRSTDGSPFSAVADAIRAGKKGTEVYKDFKDELVDLGITDIDAGEYLQQFNQILQDNGYSGLAHTGGIHGGAKHNVSIIFDTAKVRPSPTELTPEQVSDHLRTMAELQVASDDVASSMYALSTKRAQTINGAENKNKFWEIANSSRKSYMDTSSIQLGRMRDALNAKVSTFPVDQQPIISDMIQNLDARVKLATATRNAEQQVYNDFQFANKRRPHGDEWRDVINPALAKIWEGGEGEKGYFQKVSELYSDYNDLAGNIYNPGTLPNVTGGLTVQHLSQMYSASADSIAQSMVQFDSLMRRETFIGHHYGTARRLTRKLDPTKKPESFGWSEEEIGKLYDNLRVRMNTDPHASPHLLKLETELRGLRDDLNVLSMTKGKSQEVVDATNQMYRDWADSLEGITRSEVRINDLTPEPIITTRGTPRVRRPTHAPGTNVTYDLAPESRFTQSVQEAYDRAHLRYKNTFTDYTNQNIFDAVMRGIFPFWNYEAQRWPYLFRTFAQHPGAITSWGRFQDYTEDGYIHIGGTDLSVNFLRGTVLQGGLSGLVRQFPARYEKGLYGTLSTAMETMGRGGFYPGLWATIPLNRLGIVDFDVPLPIDTIVNASAFVDPRLAEIRNSLFPSRFRDFYITDEINKQAQLNGWDFNGDEARALINSADLSARQGSSAIPLTDKEERMLAAWRNATQTVAKYQLLFDQTGIFKLDIEEKRRAANLMADYIHSKTGVSKEDQDALTDRLRNTGLRLTDILPLDPKSQEELYNSLKFKYWAGNNAILPKPFQAIEDKRKEYYRAVDSINSDAKTNGFRDKDNKLTPSLESLDADFKSGKLTARDWINAQANTKQIAANRVAALTIGDSAPYAHVPITLEQRQKWAAENDQTLPVDHPAKELANLYYSIKPIEDPQTKEIDWLQYFGSIETLLATLPEDRRHYLMDFIQRDWTDTQRLYWKTSSQYLRPYQNVRELLTQAIDPAQKEFLQKYEKASDAVISNLPEEQQKLVKDYNSAVSRGRGRYLELNPESNAWNYYWGKVTTLHTEASRLAYNQIVAKYGGGVQVNEPIKEKRTVLQALP